MRIVDKKGYDVELFLNSKDLSVLIDAVKRRQEELEKKMGLNEEEIEQKQILKSFMNEAKGIIP